MSVLASPRDGISGPDRSAAAYRLPWALTVIWRGALGTCVASAAFACHRTVIEPYGHCGPYAPPGASPAVVSFERGTHGVLRVRGGDDLGGPLPVAYRLATASDTAALIQEVSDTGLAVVGLGTGRYELRATAIAHYPLTAPFDFGPDTGAVVTVRLERGAVSMCEDGIRARRLPWWRLW